MAAYSEPAGPRRLLPIALAAVGAGALPVGIMVGAKGMAVAAALFLIAVVVAVRDAAAPVFTFRNAVVFMGLVVWLIPIKGYKLPVELPFQLEVYRVVMLVLMLALVAALLARRASVSAAGHHWPLLLLGAAALGALVSNIGTIGDAGLQTQAIKSLSFFISYLVAFLLVASTLRTSRDVHVVVTALVAGATVVALEALYESRTRHNLFNDLHSVLPFLDFVGKANQNVRGGQLRVRASAQHPIALGAVLTMIIPLALYLAAEAGRRLTRVVWLLAALVLASAAFATISRTVLVMAIAMALVALWLRPRAVRRWWPAVIVLPVLISFLAPGSVKNMYGAFKPQGGLASSQHARAGAKGSGRLADVGPGIQAWSKHAIFGRGLGTGPAFTASGEAAPAAAANAAEEAGVIYDDQWLGTLVTLGIVGFIGLAWFTFGAVAKLGGAARRLAGAPSNLVAACAAATAGFGLGMLTYDALAFVQVALIFFVIVALGLRARLAAAA